MDKIDCNLFISSTLNKTSLNDNINSLSNVFLKDFTKITDTSRFNLSDSYFSPKSIYNLIEKFLPSNSSTQSSINLKNVFSNCFKEEFSGLSEFSNLLNFHKFSHLNYDDINLVIYFHDKNYFQFYHSSSFEGLKNNEIVQIAIYEIFKYSLKDFNLKFFSSIFNEELSDNVLNHISLKSENNDYASPQILKSNPNFTELCKPKSEKVINEIHEAIYEVLKQYEIFTPYLKDIKFKPKPNFDIDNIFKNKDAFIALDFIKTSLSNNDFSEFTFPKSKFDILYGSLNIQNQEDLILKYKKVMDYDFISNDFREFVIDKFTQSSLKSKTIKP